MKMRVLLVSAAAVFASLAYAQQDLSQVQIQTIQVRDNIHMLVGAGGNIGAVTGDDGTFIVDDQFAPLTDRITAALNEISAEPVRFVGQYALAF